MFVPFSGWFFNTERITESGLATSPPYDVISDELRHDLLARSPHNIVRLLLPGNDSEAYESAADLLATWREDGTLIRDDHPHFYLYESDYYQDDGTPQTARGVIGALRVEEFGSRIVPHEETITHHREDRLALLRATGANLDPIVALSAAPELGRLLQLPGTSPRIDFGNPFGSRYRLYSVDAERVAAIRAAITAHPVAIADGHHRYTTALRYRMERARLDASGPWDYIMAMISPAEGSGLTIGPYHRVLRGKEMPVALARPAFHIAPSEAMPPERPGDLVVVSTDGAHHLRPRADAFEALSEPHRQSSTAVAARLLYPRVRMDEEGASYTTDVAHAVESAQVGKGIALLVAPLAEQAIAVAGKMGLKFPPKSTFFAPKPRVGMVLRCFES